MHNSCMALSRRGNIVQPLSGRVDVLRWAIGCGPCGKPDEKREDPDSEQVGAQERCKTSQYDEAERTSYQILQTRFISFPGSLSLAEEHLISRTLLNSGAL
jgi:hypothetical protein